MSGLIQEAIRRLSSKFPQGYDGTVKFVIEGEGAILLDHTGLRAGDGPAEVTLRATAEVFQRILEGDLNPMNAFLSKRLTIDGSMGAAMKLASSLA